MTLQPPVTLSGHLLDPLGEPIPDQQVSIAPDGTSNWISHYTDSQGSYSFDVAPGTYDENLELRDFDWSRDETSRLPVSIRELMRTTEESQTYFQNVGGFSIVGQRIDVAGESFGAAAVSFSHAITAEDRENTEVLLDTWCEELDNYLAGIALSRRKHQLIGSLSRALRNPVLDLGITAAIEVLKSEVGFSDLILIYRHDRRLIQERRREAKTAT